MTITQKKEAVNKFVAALETCGDYFFSTGSIKDDYEIITGTISRQGFWAGIRDRYYFVDSLNVTRIEERSFGK